MGAGEATHVPDGTGRPATSTGGGDVYLNRTHGQGEAAAGPRREFARCDEFDTLDELREDAGSGWLTGVKRGGAALRGAGQGASTSWLKATDRTALGRRRGRGGRPRKQAMAAELGASASARDYLDSEGKIPGEEVDHRADRAATGGRQAPAGTGKAREKEEKPGLGRGVRHEIGSARKSRLGVRSHSRYYDS